MKKIWADRYGIPADPSGYDLGRWLGQSRFRPCGSRAEREQTCYYGYGLCDIRPLR